LYILYYFQYISSRNNRKKCTLSLSQNAISGSI